MKKIFIYNNHNCHYEIIESIIVKYRKLLSIPDNLNIQIYLYIQKNNSFKNYIKTKYPKIIFEKINNYDYYINCTIYDKDYSKLNFKKNSNKKYISHEITERLKTNPNVYFLTPLAKKIIFKANILPYSNNKISSNIPIYIIQGKLKNKRRNYSLLINILNNQYEHDFKIKMIGKGQLPQELVQYQNKIIIKNNLNFIDYHKEFLDGYCILPLITKKSHSQYYTNKLTSTINYASGYNLKCLIDRDLQDIYKLKNVEIFDDENNIVDKFKKTLNDFYNISLI